MFGLFKPPEALASPAAISAAVTSKLEAAPKVSHVVVSAEDPSRLDVTFDGKERRFFLDNLIALVANEAHSPRSQHRHVREYVTAFLEAAGEKEIDLSRVYPVVRHIDYIAPVGDAAIQGPVTGDLVCALMLDSPKTLSSLTQDMIEEADLAHAEIWGAARYNLNAALKDVAEMKTPLGMRTLALERNWLGLSTLLTPDLFQVARRDLGAEMLFLVAINRNGVEFVDAAEPGAFELAQAAVLEGLKQDHPQSACIYTLSDGDASPEPGWFFENGEFYAVG
ncbi:MAG: hypothetical protein AAF871_11250 [Pseudomonadota bacterium]